MKKKIYKYTVIIGLMVILSIVLFTNSSSFATWNDIYKTGNHFNKAGNIVLGIVQAVGYTVSIITATIIGIKYILTSPDGKAEIKKQAYTYLIGCALLFAGTTFISVIIKITQENIK